MDVPLTENADPLASKTFSIDGSEISFWPGYEGRPSFIVRWRSSRSVRSPIIESARALINGSFPDDFTWGGAGHHPGNSLKGRTVSLNTIIRRQGQEWPCLFNLIITKIELKTCYLRAMKHWFFQLVILCSSYISLLLNRSENL